VQTFKAGVMEIADIYAINKADRPGAERVEQELGAMLALSRRDDGWERPLVRTVATTGEGVGHLRKALERFSEFLEGHSIAKRRREDRARTRLLELLRQRLLEEAVRRLEHSDLETCVNEIIARRRDPHAAAEVILEKLLAREARRKAT
jgi:LAO/AO transport system kinase